MNKMNANNVAQVVVNVNFNMTDALNASQDKL